jgi:hypothetical protein
MGRREKRDKLNLRGQFYMTASILSTDESACYRLNDSRRFDGLRSWQLAYVAITPSISVKDYGRHSNTECSEAKAFEATVDFQQIDNAETANCGESLYRLRCEKWKC